MASRRSVRSANAIPKERREAARWSGASVRPGGRGPPVEQVSARRRAATRRVWRDLVPVRRGRGRRYVRTRKTITADLPPRAPRTATHFALLGVLGVLGGQLQFRKVDPPVTTSRDY